jgi:hypothetical protein
MSKIAEAIQAAHEAIDGAMAESASTRCAAAIERIADSLEKIERHLAVFSREKFIESAPDA